MLNTEQAVEEAERRFPGYEAEAMCTCGVYRIALRPKPGHGPKAINDERLHADGSSYEGALAALAPPALAPHTV
jgi:hypothetical protein